MNDDRSNKDYKEEIPYNVQDKQKWCDLGLQREYRFIEIYGTELFLEMNPEKLVDKYAADLINISNRRLAELKSPTTPFFTSGIKYKIDPQYAVTFNEKDYDRYLKNYPDLSVYFWVDWKTLEYDHRGNLIIVEPMQGVWKIEFPDMVELNHAKPIHIHHYIDRIIDPINAQTSYVLDLRWDEFKQII